jgi:hypothetical protein
MALNWILFSLALGLLFFPLEILLPKSFCMRELTYIDFGQKSFGKRAPWSFPALWADGIRSFLGAFLLRHAWTIEPGTLVRWLYQVPVIAAFVILSLSLVAQMHTRQSRDRFLAPVVYAIGLWLALLPLPVALVAAAAGGVCMVAFRSLSAFFFFGAFTIVAFGYFVLHKGTWALVGAGLSLLPYLLSMVCRRSLAVPVRIEILRERSRDLSRGNALRMSEADKIGV